jgi:hypothetical protein
MDNFQERLHELVVLARENERLLLHKNELERRIAKREAKIQRKERIFKMWGC